MYVIPPVPPRFILMHGSTRLGEYASLGAIGRHLGIFTLRELVFHDDGNNSAAPWPLAPKLVNTRVVEGSAEDGAVITWRQVLRAYRELVPKKLKNDRLAFWNGEGAVPGTGRSRNYRFKRRPRTNQELRLIDGVVFEDGEPEWRTRRRHLPTVWSDLMLNIDHNWKNQRKTQWK